MAIIDLIFIILHIFALIYIWIGVKEAWKETQRNIYYKVFITFLLLLFFLTLLLYLAIQVRSALKI